MYDQSIIRPRLSRGKTPPGCRTTGFIHAWHERMIRSGITDDVMLGCLITRTRYFDRWRIDVRESQEWLLKMVGRLSRFAMHPLPQNEILLNCLQTAPSFLFKVKQQRIFKFLG